MFVSSSIEKSFFRIDKKCKFHKNGSFIDIWYEDDGRKKWIGIEEKILKRFLNSDSQESIGYITFDEAANIETIIYDMINRKSIKKLGDSHVPTKRP